MPGAAAARAFLTAEWRYLVMLNYETDPAVLGPRVPAGTTIDLWHGRALVSVVGFRFLRTRVLGVPIPLHVNFDEVNLRFYVRHETRSGELRRGVTFVREMVPRAAIAAVARMAYNEPYLATPMRSTTPRGPTDAPGMLSYRWRMGRDWEQLAAETAGLPAEPEPTSESAFVAEHYWGYTRQRDGGTVEYRVTHPRWRCWETRSAHLDADVSRLYGPELARALQGGPRSAFVADGSAVTVHAPRRLR